MGFAHGGAAVYKKGVCFYAQAVFLGGAILAFAFSSVPALAVVPVPPHDHWLATGSGDVVHVGPDVCSNPDIYDAWLNFHVNVHTGVPGTEAFTNDNNPVSISATGCVEYSGTFGSG